MSITAVILGVKSLKEEIEKTLEKQLQLLSERSAELNPRDSVGLAKLTTAMSQLAEVISRFRSPCE